MGNFLIDGVRIMDTLYRFKGFVNSDLSLIKNFLDSALMDLNSFISDQEKLFDIKVILNELVINGAMQTLTKKSF